MQGLKERTNECECEIVEKCQNRPCRDVKDEIESRDRASDNYEYLHCGERKDGALAAYIAKMRLKGQSRIRSLISSRLRTSLVGSLSRFKRLELGLAGALNKVRALAPVPWQPCRES